jgi:hypothetical protein
MVRDPPDCRSTCVSLPGATNIINPTSKANYAEIITRFSEKRHIYLLQIGNDPPRKGVFTKWTESRLQASDSRSGAPGLPLLAVRNRDAGRSLFMPWRYPIRCESCMPDLHSRQARGPVIRSLYRGRDAPCKCGLAGEVGLAAHGKITVFALFRNAPDFHPLFPAFSWIRLPKKPCL